MSGVDYYFIRFFNHITQVRCLRKHACQGCRVDCLVACRTSRLEPASTRQVLSAAQPA
jgi:hypothetical protein